MGQHVIENYRQKGSDQKAYEEGWERIFGKKKGPCPCENFTVDNSFIEGKEVTCGTCGRVMAPQE